MTRSMVARESRSPMGVAQEEVTGLVLTAMNLRSCALSTNSASHLRSNSTHLCRARSGNDNNPSAPRLTLLGGGLWRGFARVSWSRRMDVRAPAVDEGLDRGGQFAHSGPFAAWSHYCLRDIPLAEGGQVRGSRTGWRSLLGRRRASVASSRRSSPLSESVVALADPFAVAVHELTA
jgi:hypothetical protein